MGAVANLRPDLFAAILAEVPFVDVLNTMCDADLPLTPPEWPEWGNPIDARGGLSADRVLFALRQRGRESLPGDLRDRRADRSQGDLLGARQVGGAAAPAEDGR